MAEKFDLDIIKVALEHATFADFRLRDAIGDLLKNVQLDLDEIGFGISETTLRCVENLNSVIADIETPPRVTQPRILLDEGELDGVREVEDTTEIETTPVINLDDELEEFENEQIPKRSN